MDISMDNGDIEKEIQWGINYRHEKNRVRTVALLPKKSPINLQKMWDKYQITKQINELERLKLQIYSKPPPKYLSFGNTINRVDRAGFTKKQYINYLATPHHYVTEPEPNPIVELRKKLKPHKCSARLVELARPTKNRVYNTWNDYWYQLPGEVIERLDALLRTDRTLDPKYARCCFRDLDRRRRREKRMRQQRRKKKKRLDLNEEWLKMEIDLTVTYMISFLEHDPLVTLSYKQTLVSNVITDLLVKHRHLKCKPMRNSSNLYQRSIVDVVDQLSAWIDSIARFIDVQYIDSSEKIRHMESLPTSEYEEEGEGEDTLKRFKLPPLPPFAFQELPSVSKTIIRGTYEGEGESYSYGLLESDAGKISTSGDDGEMSTRSEGGKLARGDDDGEMSTRDDGSKTTDGEDATDKFKTEDTSEYESGGEMGKAGVDTNEDLTTALLDILGQSGVDFKGSIDKDNLPGVTYQDVYSRIERLNSEDKKVKQGLVENAIAEWAVASDPDKVDEKMRVVIHDTAGLISDCLTKEDRTMETSTVIDRAMLYDDKISMVKAGEESEFSAGKVPPLYSIAEDTELDITTDYDEVSDARSWAEKGKAYEDEGLDALAVMKPLTVDQTSSAQDVAPVPELQVEEIMGAKEMMATRADIPSLIPKHKPSKVFEHAPDTICCLTIKVWAIWLLEVASNAQSWSKWLSDIISEIRTTARILRGEVLDSNGQPVLFYKEDWRKFVEKVEKMIISWRQYSMHVKDLTDKIIQNFHGKRITCCPKCLEDNLIANIAVAHDISQQLAEAMNTASYWRRWLDSIVMETNRLTSPSLTQSQSISDSSSYGTFELIEIQLPRNTDSVESIYEIEEIEWTRR